MVSISSVAFGRCQEKVLVAMEACFESSLTRPGSGPDCITLLGCLLAEKGEPTLLLRLPHTVPYKNVVAHVQSPFILQ